MFEKLTEKIQKAKENRSADKEIYNEMYDKVYEEERTKALRAKAAKDASKRAWKGRFEERFVDNLGKIGKGIGEVAVKGTKQLAKMAEEDKKKARSIKKGGLFEYEANLNAFDMSPKKKRR